MQTASMELYVTPVGSRFLVYRPLRPLAFVANAALVNLMAVWRYQPPPADDADPAARFLHSIGFFEPDSPAPAEPTETETFEPTIADGDTIKPSSATSPRKPPTAAPAIDTTSAISAPSASAQRSRRW